MKIRSALPIIGHSPRVFQPLQTANRQLRPWVLSVLDTAAVSFLFSQQNAPCQPPFLLWGWTSPAAQTVKKPPAVQETQVRSLGGEDPLEEGTATRSSVPAWRIPWTEEPGGLPSTELQEWDTTERLTLSTNSAVTWREILFYYVHLMIFQLEDCIYNIALVSAIHQHESDNENMARWINLQIKPDGSPMCWCHETRPCFLFLILFSFNMTQNHLKILLAEGGKRVILISVFASNGKAYACWDAKPLSQSTTVPTVARQAPVSMGCPRQEDWSGWPCPPAGDLPDPGNQPASLLFPALQAHSLPLSHRGSPRDESDHTSTLFSFLQTRRAHLTLIQSSFSSSPA